MSKHQEGSQLPSFSDALNAVSNKTNIVKFDGTGQDPTQIAGYHIEWHEIHENPARLEIQCLDGALQFRKEGLTENWEPALSGHNYEICMDGNLEKALHRIDYGQYQEVEIMEAVTAVRESNVCRRSDIVFSGLKHRVIGLRLEGMQDLGYIYCKLEYDDRKEVDDMENYELWYHDIVLAPHPMLFKSP